MSDAMADPGHTLESLEAEVDEGRNMNLAGPVPAVDDPGAARWLMLARQEVVRFQIEAAKYVDLQLLNSASRDWNVLAADLSSGDHIKIVAASRELMQHGAKGVDALIKLVTKTKDVRARALALDLLRRIISDKEIETRLLNAALAIQVPEEKINLLNALHDFATPEVGPKVEGLVQHQDSTIRRAAYDLLAKIGPGIFTQAIFNALEDDIDEVKADAIRAVGEQKLQMGVKPLLKFVPITTVFQQEKFERIQALACQALGEVGDERATGRLLGILARQSVPNRTKRPEVRAAAAMALARLVDATSRDRIVAALQKACKDSNLLVANAAQVALKQVQAGRRADSFFNDEAPAEESVEAEESVF